MVVTNVGDMQASSFRARLVPSDQWWAPEEMHSERVEMESRRDLLEILVKTLSEQLARAETELAEVASQLAALPQG